MRSPRITAALWISLAPAVVLACAVEAAGDVPTDRAADHDADVDEDVAVQAAPAAAPARTMPNARASFDEIAALIGSNYVGGGIDDDALWTAAAEGVLARLEQHPEHPINELLSPADLGELEAGVKGKLSGIGVVIERVGDVLVVREALRDGPAARAGIRGGDRILGIDGERVGAADIATLVGKIRGAKGTKVDLFVQRDTEEWTVPVTRDDVEIPSVEARTLEGGVGYLRIGAMGQQTAEHLDVALDQLRRDRVRTLVVDLRGSPGGWFEAATAVGERFVAAGTELVRVRDREGHEKAITAARDGAWTGTPMVVLIGHGTSSGAEIVAAALREHAGASLVGAPSFGKTTVESIHQLANGWALKLSEQRFVLADGSQGVVRPDVEIASPEHERMPPLDQLDPAADAPLATALQLLRGRE
jgi:carboxyl-terminal processing protease